MKREFKVSESFIREAHSAACKDWKRKLEMQFPEVLGTSMQSLINKIGDTVYGYMVYGVPQGNNNGLVFVPLPNANTEWTFEAFDYVKKFCCQFDAYPDHTHTEKNINCLHNAYPHLEDERYNWLVIRVKI